MRGIEVYEPGKYRLRHDLPLPEPGHGQVRVKVLAAGICGTDVHICEGDPSLEPMMRFPVVLGHEFCGRIEKLGEEVSGLEPGRYVSAEMHEFCNGCPACRAEKFHACQNTRIHGLWLDGCFADYVVVSAKNLVQLPESLPVRVPFAGNAAGIVWSPATGL
ncbi:MAG: alcohol dehydrogenase catalytic domain-containing protein, partial [Planctomycetota bacterium]